MMFPKYLPRLAVCIFLIPGWIYVGWTLVNGTFHWRYLVGATLPIIFWAVYRWVHEQNEAAIDKEERAIDKEERLKRFRRHRDQRGRRGGAQSRNRWKEHRWEAAHPEAREPDE